MSEGISTAQVSIQEKKREKPTKPPIKKPAEIKILTKQKPVDPIKTRLAEQLNKLIVSDSLDQAKLDKHITLLEERTASLEEKSSEEKFAEAPLNEQVKGYVNIKKDIAALKHKFRDRLPSSTKEHLKKLEKRVKKDIKFWQNKLVGEIRVEQLKEDLLSTETKPQLDKSELNTYFKQLEKRSTDLETVAGFIVIKRDIATLKKFLDFTPKLENPEKEYIDDVKADLNKLEKKTQRP